MFIDEKISGINPKTFLNGSARITGMVPDRIAVTEFCLETENFHRCYRPPGKDR